MTRPREPGSFCIWMCDPDTAAHLSLMQDKVLI